MNNLFEQLTERAKRLILSPEDKGAIRASLLEHASAHPLSEVAKGAPDATLAPVRVGDPIRHHLRTQNLKVTKHNTPMSIVIIIALLLSGSVSYAAEGSVPGDALYVVKTEVNEPLRGALAMGAEAQANFEARLATERLMEAQKLATEGRLNAEISADLKERFEARAQRTQERVKELGKNDAAVAAGISSEFEASLMAHEQILARFKGVRGADVTTLLGSISTHIGLTKESREQAELSVGAQANSEVRVAAEGKARATLSKITEVSAYIERKKDRLSAEASAQAQAKIALASSVYAEGSAKLEGGLYAEAFSLFQGALRKAQEAKAQAQFAAEFELSGRSSNAEDASTSSTAEANVEAEVDVDIPEVNLPEVEVSGNTKTEINIGL